MNFWIILTTSLYGTSIGTFWYLFRYFAIYKETGYFFREQPVSLREILLSCIWPLILVWYYFDYVRKQK